MASPPHKHLPSLASCTPDKFLGYYTKTVQSYTAGRFAASSADPQMLPCCPPGRAEGQQHPICTPTCSSSALALARLPACSSNRAADSQSGMEWGQCKKPFLHGAQSGAGG
jgi:hypothetical protein